jgi:hypothetical protein
MLHPEVAELDTTSLTDLAQVNQHSKMLALAT